MNLGMVGLGRMGANMVERLREHGHTVETYARTNPERTADSLPRDTPMLTLLPPTTLLPGAPATGALKSS